MSAHIDEALLFASGDALDAEARGHIASCEQCRARHRRLDAGRAIIEEVRRDSSPDVAWQAIDSKIMSAAQSAAADIRRGTLRPSRRPMVMAYAGVALAAAAAMVFIVKQQSGHAPSVIGGGPAAHNVASNGSSGGSTDPHGVGAQPSTVSHAIEPRVLLLASPVTYASRGGSPEPMTAHTVARAGGRIATGERTGRAVFGLHAGYRVDARAGTEIELAALSSDDMTMVLTKGEARVDGPALEHGRVAMRAGEWTVLAKGGGFVTRLDGDSVRVRVIAGKVHVSRDGSAEREVLAGDEIELGATATEPRLVAHGASDADALDEHLFADDGEALDLPAAVSGAALSVDGVALPAGVTALRLREPRMLVARSGAEEWSLAVDPRDPSTAPAWRRARTIAFGAIPRASDVRAAAAATPVASSAVPTNAVAQVEPTAMNGIAPLPPDPTPGNGPMGRQQLERELTTRSASCYTECMSLHSCGAGIEAHVHIDPERDGRVVNLRVEDITSTAVSECIAGAARSLRIPTFMTTGTIHLTVHPPQP